MSRLSRALDLPLAPILLPAAFVLSVGFGNEVPLNGMVRPLIATLCIGMGLWALLWLATRNHAAASLISAGILAALISLDLLTSSMAYASTLIGPVAAFVAVGAFLYLTVAVGAVFWLRGRKRRFAARGLHRHANEAAIILLLTVLVTGGLGEISRLPMGQRDTALDIRCSEDSTSAASGVDPDIYQILLDGYPRADTLEDRFSFDNTTFLDALRARGLTVDEDSHSNYTFTSLTFSSMFNMRYLDQVKGVSELIGDEVSGRSELRAAIETGSVFSILRRAGYRIITTPSGWEHVSTREAGDEFLDHGEITDFERNLIERTWVPDLTSWFAGDWFAAQQRSRILHEFADIATVARRSDPEPLFLFAHIPMPHHPIVFAQHGAPLRMGSLRDWSRQISDLGRTSDQYGAIYTDQLSSANELVLEAIDAIKSTTRQRPTVIIVMSDHGYTHEMRRVDPHDRLSNLFAAYTPDHPGLIRATTTPVNLFGRLFNGYLGTCAQILPNRYYVSANDTGRLNFAQVIDPESHTEPTFRSP